MCVPSIPLMVYFYQFIRFLVQIMYFVETFPKLVGLILFRFSCSVNKTHYLYFFLLQTRVILLLTSGLLILPDM